MSSPGPQGLLLATLCGAVLMAATDARAAEPCASFEPARGPMDCPEIFGDQLAQESNRRRREALLVEISAEPHGFAIVHRGEWREPLFKQYRDLELVDTATGPTCAPVALVQLEENG